MRAAEEELLAVKAAMESEKRSRIKKRYCALYLSLSGRTCNEVVEIVGLCKPMVCRIKRVYAVEGLAGIPDKPRTGRPRSLSPRQENHVREVIRKKNPSEAGFPGEYNWTADLIRKYISREYQVGYTIRGITGLLKRLGFTYIHPTYVFTKEEMQER